MVNPCLAKVARAKCCVKYLEFIAMAYVGVAVLLLILSMFMPRWRVDRIGTQQLSAFWVLKGFEEREYGLLQVRGTFSQSWSTVATSACDFRTFGMVVNAGQLVGNAASNVVDVFKEGGQLNKAADLDASCEGNNKCANGFAKHMWNRCHEYEKLFRVSMVTVAFTFVSIIMCVAGIFFGTLTNIKRTGGISFGLFLGGTILAIVMNLVWAVITDFSFKTLGEDAWFPYPSLAIGYFLHLHGGLIMFVSTGIFGYLVLPVTWAYDPAQEKIDKRNRNLQKLKADARLFPGGLRSPGTQQPTLPVSSMNFPPPPGFPFPQAGQIQSFGGQQDPGLVALCNGPEPLTYGHPNLHFGAPCGGGPQMLFAGQAPSGNAFSMGGPGTHGSFRSTDGVPFLQANGATDFGMAGIPPANGPTDFEMGGAVPPQFGQVKLGSA
mmetsp:Transcript_87881/g.243805  ORF Transcript_87881/g.243805 Transcript_87881/m.243805 type:complete len:435 (-) Transcript_87881:253-1557(-)